MSETTLIGIDCATEDDRTGVARGRSDGTRCRASRQRTESLPSRCQSGPARPSGPHRDRLAAWLARGARAGSRGALRGRPIPFKPTRSSRASAIATCGRNCTRSRLRSAPTGSRGRRGGAGGARADRTAIGTAWSLAWEPTFKARVAVIEVYPAATLIGLGGRSSGYKRDGDSAERAEILRRVSEEIQIEGDAEKRGRTSPTSSTRWSACSPATTSCAAVQGAGGSVDRGSAVPQDARRAAFRDPVASSLLFSVFQ